MKKLTYAFILLTFISAFSSGVSAQPKKISEEEYKAVQRRHNPTGTNYRMRISDRRYQKTDGALIRFTNQLKEVTASGDSHEIIESGKNDGYVQKSEVYIIGETVYDLHPNGTWRVNPLKKNYTLVSEPKNESQKEISTEYFYKGKVLLQDKTADLYEIVQITKIKLKDSELITKTIRRNWYDSDGRPLYSELNTDSDKQTSQAVIKFEYDVKDLKFTPPVK